MSIDFHIEFAPNGDKLRLNLRSKDAAQAGKPFDRQPLDLLPDDINKLRIGTANPLIVDKITADVSQWLLGDTLGDNLQTAMDSANGEKMRVVLSVNDEQLQKKLSDIPFELCQPAGALGAIPIVLESVVESIVHLLPKIGTPPLSPKDRFPLNILLLRSNPAELGGAVPPAEPLRNEIYALIDAHLKLNRNHVQVHVLSSEAAPDLIGKPTYETLKTQLESEISYDILVYLGHGDVLQSYPEKPPVGVLQFEADEVEAGEVKADSVSSIRLARLLNRHPVPVVLLIGCLTASDIPVGRRPDVESGTPAWMRGSQAVAQALINSSSGVKIVVGMRYRLEKEDAKFFLKGFFKSLLRMRPGHVEAAVHQARNEMSDGNQNSYSWASPMLFRSLESEPLFPFLAAPPEAVCPNLETDQNLRETLWKHLSKTSWSLRALPQSGTEALNDFLQEVESKYISSVLAKVPYLLLPELVEGHHGEPVTVPVKLRGQLKVDSLRGDLNFGGEQIRVVSLTATQELLDKGYDVLSSTKENSAGFLIERKSGDDDLPEGTLFNVTVELGQAYPVVNAVNVNILNIAPHKAICTGNNAVIVPPP